MNIVNVEKIEKNELDLTLVKTAQKSFISSLHLKEEHKKALKKSIKNKLKGAGIIILFFFLAAISGEGGYILLSVSGLIWILEK